MKMVNNYIFSFLTNNVVDDQNLVTYDEYNTYDRFDCSKIDQWEVVFEHVDKRRMFLHFKTLEAENQGLLDSGAIGVNAKLYYRELIACFGTYLSLNWNIGEEIGDWLSKHLTAPMDSPQRLAMFKYFYQNYPYHNHTIIHNGTPFDDILDADSKYIHISLQTHKTDFSLVHNQVKKWLEKSEEAGKLWAVAIDKKGDVQHALISDAEDPGHDNTRKNELLGAFMIDAFGTERYFGSKHIHSDLTRQDF